MTEQQKSTPLVSHQPAPAMQATVVQGETNVVLDEKEEKEILEKNWPLISTDLTQMYPGLTTEQAGSDGPDVDGIAEHTGLSSEQVEDLLSDYAVKYRNSDPDTLATNPDNLDEEATPRSSGSRSSGGRGSGTESRSAKSETGGKSGQNTGTAKSGQS
jgi:hypothetical protein